MQIDHLVLNTQNVAIALAFYCDVLQLPQENEQLWRCGDFPFASVRVSEHSVIDFFPPSLWHRTGQVLAGAQKINHFSLSVSQCELEKIASVMQTQSITFRATVPHLWGAQGFGTSYYLEDPDGNEVELRTYDAGTKDVQIRVEWMLASQLVDRLDSPLREAVTGVFGNTRCLVVWGNHQALGVLVACADEPRVVVLPAWAHLPIEHRLRARYELATSERSER